MIKASVIVFPGSNCDRDAAIALAQATGEKPAMIWHGEASVPDDIDLIVLPGGFCYGDYLRSGAMAAHSPVMRDIVAKAKKGVSVLGICNGFQVLTEAGLLPGVLMRNASLKFICRDVHLKVETASTPFTGKYAKDAVIRIPIAHHDGNYYADDKTLSALEDHGRIIFRYCSADGVLDGQANPTANPNGSRNNIAGIINEAGNVLGMMPHPERLADPLLGGSDGRPLFDSLVAALS